MSVRPAVLLGSIAAALVAAPLPMLAAEREDSPTVQVTGRGEVTAAPDRVKITVGVVTEAESAAEAVKSNNQAMQQLVTALRDAGIPEENLQTTSFNVSPQRRHEPNQTPQITGYQATNQVVIQVDTIDGVGQLLDAAVKAGANHIQNIQFSISNRDRRIDEARKAAVKDARRKAELYAEAAGVRLGHVLSISELSGDPRPYAARQFSAEAAAGVPIAPGEETLSVSVSVSYQLITGQ